MHDNTQQIMDTLFMARAVELSRDNMRRGEGGPFGAVIVKDGQIIGEGWNRVTSSNDPTAHAEVVAIRRACEALGTFNLHGATLYTSCEPCPMCLASTYWASISRLVYANDRRDAAAIGFDDEFLYSEVTKPMAERAIPTVHLTSPDALAVFQEWQMKTDKVEY